MRPGAKQSDCQDREAPSVLSGREPCPRLTFRWAAADNSIYREHTPLERQLSLKIRANPTVCNQTIQAIEWLDRSSHDRTLNETDKIWSL